MKETILSLLIRGVGFLFSAGQTIFLARILGVEDLGIYAAILAIITILATPTAGGLAGYLTRELALAKSKANYPLARGLVRAANGLLLGYFTISILILLFLAGINLFPKSEPIYILLAALMILLLGADQLRAGAMRGMGSALLSQLPAVVIRPGIFLAALIIFSLIWDSISITAVLIAFIAGSIIATGFGHVALYRQLSGYSTSVRVGLVHPAQRSVGLVLLGVLGALQANIDIALLSMFGFYIEAGLYRVALLGIVALLFVYDALSAITVRDLAATMAQEDKLGTFRVSDRLTLLASSVALVITVVFLLAGEYSIKIIFGEEFAQASQALIVLSIGHTVAIACGPSMEIVRLLSSQRIGVMVNLTSVIISVLISLSLLGWNALLAVAIGSALGNIFRRSVLAIHVSKKIGGNITIIGSLIRLSPKRINE